MTRIVVASFSDAAAARRAAVALGRAELAAGPTRVQVDASAPERGARLELRVDEPDARRAIALMREHGAAVAERPDERGPHGASPLAAWGMAVADAVTGAMGGATASDAQVPARVDEAVPPDPRDRAAAGSGSGTHMSDTVAAGTASDMGRTGPDTLERADDVPIRDPRPPRRRPKSDA